MLVVHVVPEQALTELRKKLQAQHQVNLPLAQPHDPRRTVLTSRYHGTKVLCKHILIPGRASPLRLRCTTVGTNVLGTCGS